MLYLFYDFDTSWLELIFEKRRPESLIMPNYNTYNNQSDVLQEKKK